MSAPLLMPSMRRPSGRVGATTAVLGFDLSAIGTTMGPSSSILTATTSKRSAMGQNRKPKVPDPLFPLVRRSGVLRRWTSALRRSTKFAESTFHALGGISCLSTPVGPAEAAQGFILTPEVKGSRKER